MQPRKLYQRVKVSLRNRLGLPAPLVEAELLGRRLRVRHGSIRSRSDKDDAWLFACACHAEHVVDIGANIGQAALLMLQAPTLRSITLVDPNVEALAVAADNLIRNRMSDRVRFIPAFVSDEDDRTITFWTVGVGSAGSRYPGHAQTAARKQSSMEVPTLTLDTLCARHDLAPDLVKIDVEGAEHEVLLGGREVASHQRARFFVEMHSPPELPMIENARRVLHWCEETGYRAWYLKEKTRLEQPQQIQHRGRCHLLLQPVGWPFPEWLANIEQSAPLNAVIAESTDGA